MSARIVLLVLQDRPPFQILVDNHDRYQKLRTRLNNFLETEVAQPSSALPTLTLEQTEKILGIPSGFPQKNRTWLKFNRAK